MDIRSLDLNLLTVFDAMVRHRSVTRAAEAVGLSQPATSAVLARLRAVFGDPLFVRTGQEMQPTPRAFDLVDPVRLVIETINTEILRLSAFDAATSERTFTIVTPDIGEVTFMPQIVEACAREAPGISLRSRSLPPDQAGAALESGHADLALGFFPDLHKAGFYQQKLFKTGYVCITCGNTSDLAKRITFKAFFAARHVIVRPEGRDHLFEQFLQVRRLTRRVAIEVAHYMSLLVILPGTELIATVPREIAEVIARHVEIRIFDVPLPSPTIEVQQFWHRRLHKDPGSTWLRGRIHSLLRR